MQKTMKRTLALILAVVLCFSAMPFSAFAVEMTPDETQSSQAQPSEAPAESSQPEPSTAPEVSPQLGADATPGPDESPKPTATPEASPSPSVEPSPTPAEPADPYETELTQVDAQQIWPALQRARARAAAGVGTGGVLQMGYYCFKSEVGTLTTLGEYVSQMPAKTMLINGTNVAAYCLEHEKGATGGTPYTWTDMSVNAQDTVGTIMALGFQWSAADFWTGPSDNGDKWAVTQLLIWETINGHAFMQGNGLFGVEAAVDADMEKCAPHAYNPTKFLEYYRDLKKRLNDYMKVPSFASKEPEKANVITLKWDGSKYSATVTDTNKVMEHYRFESCLPGVKVVANGNSITLSSTEAILNPKTSSAVTSVDSKAGGKGAVAVWRTSDSSQQNFATYNAAGGEPVRCFIKVKTDAVGSAGLKKTSEDGKVEGIQFQITGSDGSSTTKTTDASGNIDIEGLPIYSADGSKITYTATEINVPNKYVKPQSQTFQLTEWQTASIHFENKLKRWRVTVTKADNKTGSTPQGNGSLKGATFGVYQGGTLVKEYTVGDDNTFTTDYFPYGEDWTLKEISAGEGYKVSTVVTDLCEIPAGSNEEFNDNTATVTNEVIRGGVSIEKRDSKTGERPQGDADFSGIQFEIVNKSKNPVEVGGKKAAPDEVAMTITTNAQGVASTGPNVLPYGDYLIRESRTNASMLKTFTKEIPVTVSENGKVYTFTAENDVVRGGIAVEKRDSQTGERPQGNADFSGITFEVVNSSRNPVEVDGTTYATGQVVATLITDKSGYASTEDEVLPYGTYTVREVATNTSMLHTFKEQTVPVTEHKKTYVVTAENDVVRGGLAVEKRDSVTGSTPQGNADFSGITFEIINDSRNPVIVGDKSIGHGEVALTLTTDSEGKASTAADALPYGSYILHESATNESMLNTAPDQPVEVTENGKVYPFFMDNEVVRGGVLIEKRDLESLLLTPLGGASLDGTLFEITNKSRNPVYVNGALYQPDEVCLTIEVKDGVAQSDVRALPYGSYTLAESKPGTGYLWTDKTIRPFDMLKDGSVKEYREGDAAYNQVKRGDLKFVKVGEKNMHRFANVAFKLTSQTTGESHILTTDSNGEVRTETKWNAHTLNDREVDDENTPETFRKTSALSRHISYLKDFFRAYKDFTATQLDTIEFMLQKLYRRFDMDDHTDFSSLPPDSFPTMSDFYDLLEDEYNLYDQKKKNLFTEETLQEICLALNSMCEGAEARFFNGHTNIKDDKFLCFGVKDVLNTNKSLKDALLFSILSYMTNAMLGEGNCVGAVDELYLFLTNLTAIEYIRNLMKRVRKRNSTVLIASQNIEDFLLPSIREFTKPLFSIPTHQFLFNAGQTDPQAYIRTLQMEEAEFELIKFPERGTCLYRCGNERYLLQVGFPDFKTKMFGEAGGR